MTTLQKSVADKDLSCRTLKEQLDALEKEMAAKLGDMEQFKKDIQVNPLMSVTHLHKISFRQASSNIVFMRLLNYVAAEQPVPCSVVFVLH